MSIHHPPVRLCRLGFCLHLRGNLSAIFVKDGIHVCHRVMCAGLVAAWLAFSNALHTLHTCSGGLSIQHGNAVRKSLDRCLQSLWHGEGGYLLQQNAACECERLSNHPSQTILQQLIRCNLWIGADDSEGSRFKAPNHPAAISRN